MSLPPTFLLLDWARADAATNLDELRLQQQQVGPASGLADAVTVTHFEALDGTPELLTIYEVDDHDVLGELDSALGAAATSVPATPSGSERISYRCRSLLAEDGTRPVQAPYLYCVRASVTAGNEDEYRSWLDEEHRIRQLEVDGARSYVGAEPLVGPVHFLNLWGLDAPEVLTSQAWDDARKTPWRERLASASGPSHKQVYIRSE